MSNGLPRARGFTLLEVLVALAIFAIVAAVVLTAAGRSVSNAGRLEALTLAGWIADNRLTELQLQQPAPSIGREDRQLEFGGRQWQTLSEVETSGTPGLLRIRVWVAAAESRHGNTGSIERRAVTSLTGFVGVDQ
ncbi:MULTISPECIES: type II secretion system minor pseudopilin GspI [Pseudomonadaceae]|uniref:type II secretion system minor pseudopilin GspI n=1 Tax=Pseudomonadaceae TaxID=135621 RepID=UPI00103D99F1|nr:MULTISPECIES: type II secretion system minor pseudopilin GspI [Pseudomonadaceae]MBA1276274.1 type II secretion system minor pseudopilin GspI [Stutzerimonas stutzeri]MBC8648782.1 type II secretion system protein GspI [Pseudomonas sp. MT4]QXY92756.1 type II secretion system minor pseudopilin GspI [Pseudomonas sp. MTM4]TCD22410.1 type II secretion system protein GspI [Pseudomonas sp. IC_126]